MTCAVTRLNSIWADDMAAIPVPKTPKTAYNPNRTPGTLLQNQLKHLEWAIRPAAKRRGKFACTPAKTEAEAADRIEELMLELHRQTVGRSPIAQARPAKSARSTSRARRVSKPQPRRQTSR